jgi:glycosyltransferase involved in cell wall biosynthesis
VIVGDDPYRTTPRYMREVLASAADEGIEHIGWIDNAPGVMRHLDVLVLPSYEEPGGTVLAEAMAVGTPVVATAVDGLPEVVQGREGRPTRAFRRSCRVGGSCVEVLGKRIAMGEAAREWAQQFGIGSYVGAGRAAAQRMRVAFDSRAGKDDRGICALLALPAG